MRPITRSTLPTLAVLVAAFGFLSGCATVFGPEKQVLSLDSDPPGATASWNGQTAATPGAMVVSRKTEEVRLRFEKPGYASCLLRLEKNKSGLYWANLAWIPAGLVAGFYTATGGRSETSWSGLGNALVGAAVGGAAAPLLAMGIDVLTGHAYEHEPEKVLVGLAPAPDGKSEKTAAEPTCTLRKIEPRKPSDPAFAASLGSKAPDGR